MNSISPIFHELSRTSDLTWEERVLTKRSQRLLPNFSYKLWTDQSCIELIQQNWPHTSTPIESKSGIIKADLCRYAILYDFGGIYLDTDYKLVRSIGDLLQSGCLLPIEFDATPTSDMKLGNAVLASCAKHPFWKGLLEYIFVNHQEGFDESNPVEATGPMALTKFWRLNRSSFPI